MLDPDAFLPAVDPQAALADYGRYVEANTIEDLAQALRVIESAAYEADLTEAGGARAAERVIGALGRGEPFSLMRIGDGEGNIMGAFDPDFAVARCFSTRLILEMMFGTADFPVREIEAMRRDMADAIESADVLGVSDPVRIGRLQILRDEPGERQDVRGYMGSYESILQVASRLRETGRRPPLAVSNHAHRHMMAHFPAIIAAAGRVTLIGPYDLGQAFMGAFGREARTLLIPNQASSTPGEGAKWYPEHHDALLAGIRPTPGELFLVSAGLLGKGLCRHVKAGGGVALDIGSAVDVWRGKPVRAYHDPGFITRFRLPQL